MNANRTIAVTRGTWHKRRSEGRRLDRRAVHHRNRWHGPQPGRHGRFLSGPDYLAQVAAQPNQVAIGALLILLAGFALALVPVVFWPIGKRYNETLAIGYIVFRGALETVIYIVTVFGWLLLIPLSKEPDAGPLAGFVRTAETVV